LKLIIKNLAAQIKLGIKKGKASIVKGLGMKLAIPGRKN